MTFNTGVAQGSITSLQLFNIFINALLRMLTVTGQNEDQKGDNQRNENGYQFNNIGVINYQCSPDPCRSGLQIAKDQKGDNQRNENGYQFNNIGVINLTT